MYEALEEVCASDPRLTEFRGTGLERSAALTKVRCGVVGIGKYWVQVYGRVEYGWKGEGLPTGWSGVGVGKGQANNTFMVFSGRRTALSRFDLDTVVSP